MMQLDYISTPKVTGPGRWVRDEIPKIRFGDWTKEPMGQKSGKTHLLTTKNLNLHIFLEKWREAWHIQWVFYTYFVQQVPS